MDEQEKEEKEKKEEEKKLGKEEGETSFQNPTLASATGRALRRNSPIVLHFQLDCRSTGQAILLHFELVKWLVLN